MALSCRNSRSARWLNCVKVSTGSGALGLGTNLGALGLDAKPREMEGVRARREGAVGTDCLTGSGFGAVRFVGGVGADCLGGLLAESGCSKADLRSKNDS